MTTAEFRKIALSFPEATEKSHFGHPDFRVQGKIFATLGYPRKGYGVVMLTSKDQKVFVESNDAFEPVKGKWGLLGATVVELRTARKTRVRQALVAAWRKAAAKKLVERVDVQ